MKPEYFGLVYSRDVLELFFVDTCNENSQQHHELKIELEKQEASAGQKPLFGHVGAG